MENISFVLWLVLFPVTLWVCDLLGNMSNSLKGETLRKPKRQKENNSEGILLVFYIIIACLLYKK